MVLKITNLQRLYPINKTKIKKQIEHVLKSENKKDAELSIVFVDNTKIKELNKTFLGHNDVTDVLSFPYDVSYPSGDISGEIIVSVEMAIKIAQEHGESVEGEIALYFVHGLLHLIGYNDKLKEEAERMHRREGEILASLGYTVSVPNE